MFVSCNVSDAPIDETLSTDAQTQASTETEKSEDATVADKEPTNIPNSFFDYNLEHKIIATDSKNRKLVVYDMNKCIDERWNQLRNDDAIVWEWGEKSGISSAKYRYSQYYDRYVMIIATNSAGWCGIVDYETQEVLWKAQANYNSHGIEMLPNGDIVVIGSEPGRILYFPLTQNGESSNPTSQEILLPGAHDALYDPDRETLWVVYDHGVQGYKIDENNQLIETLNVKLGEEEEDTWGHAIAACYGQKGKYLVSAWKYIYVFDAENGTMERAYNALEAKGIAYFEDGTTVMTLARVGTHSKDWLTNSFNIRTRKLKNGEEFISESYVSFSDREFYKVFAMNPSYN